ncbi:hypothetical protein THTE_1943 [Thermogutta terrifontis]|uniref:Uncharacterized protein n=1 Tax=Thermogutta terrifontis TaxID=1331910 RepID=A0A286RF06_9BACT|nr:hypothetical protein THTE_1943 [Thermogutta terrifontis]
MLCDVPKNQSGGLFSFRVLRKDKKPKDDTDNSDPIKPTEPTDID